MSSGGDAADPADRRPDRRRLALYLTVFFSGLGSSVATPLLPDLQTAFNVSVSQVVLVTSVWATMRLVTDLPLGLLIDRLAPGRVLVGGTGLALVGALVSAFAPTFEVLLVGRAVSGLGSALIGLAAIVTLLGMTDPARTGRALGFYQATLQAGSAFGPVIGGLIAPFAGWPGAFAVAGIGSTLATGALILSGTASGRRAPAKRPKASAPSPHRQVIPSRARRIALLAAVNGVTFALFFVTGGIIDSALPLFGATHIGLDAPTIGLILGVATGLRFLVSIGGAELSDRVGRLPIILVGMVVLLVGLVAIPATTTVVLFAAATWTLAMGRIGNSVPIAMLSDVAEPQQMGRMVGVNRFVADLGLVSGPIAVGLLIERAGFGTAFLATAGLVVASTALLLLAAPWRGHRRRVGEAAEARPG